MYAKLLYFVGIICRSYSIISASKAPFITKCSRTDSDCMLKSATEVLPMFVNGMPELGVESMDPYHVKYIDGSSENLKYVLTNVTMTGMKDCVLLSIGIIETTLELSVECTWKIRGKYKAEGEIMVLPIKGRGDTEFDINKAQFDFTCDIYEEKHDDGKKYFNVENADYTYVLKEKAAINANGLFNDNKFLGLAVEQLYRTKPNEIIMELGTPIIDYFMDKVVENIKNFFHVVPVEDLVLN